MTSIQSCVGLNLGKCHCKILSVSNKKVPMSFQYTVNNVALDWVDSFKFLGVRVNRKLRWDDQCTDAATKATKVLNLLRRSLHGCKQNIKKRAYLALVRPHLEYCAPVWSPHYQKDKAKLERVQRRATHWICSKWDPLNHCWSKSYDEELNELGWPTISQRHTLLVGSQVYKIVHSLDSIDCSRYFVLRNGRTRSQNSIVCIQSRINSFRYSFFVNSPFIWNSLPLEVTNSASLYTFKRNLSAFLLGHRQF